MCVLFQSMQHIGDRDISNKQEIRDSAIFDGRQGKRRDDRRNTSKTTVSGYSKNEVYKMLSKTVYENETETACYMSAELICTQGELRGVCSLLTDVFCEHGLSVSIMDEEALVQNFLISEVSTNLRKVILLSERDCRNNNNTNKKKSDHVRITSEHQSVQLRNNVCKTVLELCKYFEYIKSLRQRRNIEKIERSTRTQLRMHNGHRSILTFPNIQENPDFAGESAKKLNKAFSPIHLTGDLQKLLVCIFDACVRNDTRTVMDILEYATKRDEDCRRNTYPRIIYPEIKNVTARQREDVVWYLWRLCMLITDSDRHDFTKDALFLFQLGYKKTVRGTRLPLLFSAFEMAVEGGPPRHRLAKIKQFAKECDSIVRLACDNIHVIYEDIARAASEIEGVPHQVVDVPCHHSETPSHTREIKLRDTRDKQEQKERVEVESGYLVSRDDNYESELFFETEEERKPRDVQRDLGYLFFHCPVNYELMHEIWCEVQEERKKEKPIKKIYVHDDSSRSKGRPVSSCPSFASVSGNDLNRSRHVDNVIVRKF